MRFQRILEQVYHRPWFITAEGHATIHQLVQSKLVRADLGDEMAQYCNQRQPFRIDENGIAHIHVFGVLGYGLSPIEKACGNTDYAELQADATAAAASKGVMVHVDSPGGQCAGCVETARMIAEIPVPKISHTSTICGSAAYAIAAGCDRVYSTDSALVGSIGTICPWIDTSAAWERVGLDFQPVVSEGADLKASGHGPSLTPEQREGMQELVNDYGAQFLGHVKTYRSPSPEVFRAGAYAGSRALSYGLVDALLSEVQAYATLIS